MSEIRDYVLVVRNGRWDRGEVLTQYLRVRAYDAKEAGAQFQCRAWDNDGPLQTVVNVVPYEPAVHGELAVGGYGV